MTCSIKSEASWKCNDKLARVWRWLPASKSTGFRSHRSIHPAFSGASKELDVSPLPLKVITSKLRKFRVVNKISRPDVSVYRFWKSLLFGNALIHGSEIRRNYENVSKPTKQRECLWGIWVHVWSSGASTDLETPGFLDTAVECGHKRFAGKYG